jgi:hypothetical protein
VRSWLSAVADRAGDDGGVKFLGSGAAACQRCNQSRTLEIRHRLNRMNMRKDIRRQTWVDRCDGRRLHRPRGAVGRAREVYHRLLGRCGFRRGPCRRRVLSRFSSAARTSKNGV